MSGGAPIGAHLQCFCYWSRWSHTLGYDAQFFRPDWKAHYDADQADAGKQRNAMKREFHALIKLASRLSLAGMLLIAALSGLLTIGVLNHWLPVTGLDTLKAGENRPRQTVEARQMLKSAAAKL
ncbi:MAG: hypothetical protein KGS72_15225 [Cyanobacteria bacterium REEB67]|nr:hypothetical protein [Cyanobacteria bacterium REEB67]